jgi:RNA polymerase sigma factor (sigma-70 family)
MVSVETAASQDRWVSEALEREGSRLRNFIAKRVEDAAEADDILQDVFYELVAAAHMTEPIERVGAWLFRVARNRIVDRFRKKRPVTFSDAVGMGEESEMPRLDELLPSPDAGPEAAYARTILLAELQSALGELPAEQREAFVAHEIEGRAFSDIAAQTGVSVNALILRKHKAVLFLRGRLRDIHDYLAEM